MANYFVDEAGDSTLFDDRGRVLIGTPGCTRFFILGCLEIQIPQKLEQDLQTLRTQLAQDPYVKRAASMQPEAKKTALAFHATDDLPEVRREVYALLMEHPIRFFAVVRNKDKVLDYVRQRNQIEATYRYHPNELYDYMVRRLFKTRLHKEKHYTIYFARRGQSDRTAALRAALTTAQQNFGAQWGKPVEATLEVIPAASKERGALQAVDYFLWATQHLFEMGDDRFLVFIWDKVRLIHDLDDTRTAQYGVYYTRKKPLDRAALR